MNTNKPSLKSVVLESSVKPSLGWYHAAQAWFGRRFKNHRLRMEKLQSGGG